MRSVKWGRAWPVLALAATSTLAACGAGSTTGSATTLESWRNPACAVLTSYSKALDTPEREAADAPLFSNDDTERQIESMEAALAELRAIPLPDEHRSDAERFLQIFAISLDRYKDALPRIEAASRRLDRAIKSIDPDELPPPPEEPTTVAGGIMSQLMSIPEIEEAFGDLMRAYESGAAGIDVKEAERVTERLGLTECGKPAPEKGLSSAELSRCGSRGAPVTVQKLVEVFRANGISLEIEEETCGKPEGKQVAGFDSDATNSDDRELEEGYILCDVEDAGFAEGVAVTKYDTDTEGGRDYRDFHRRELGS
jgi:hypothetical protein